MVRRASLTPKRSRVYKEGALPLRRAILRAFLTKQASNTTLRRAAGKRGAGGFLNENRR